MIRFLFKSIIAGIGAVLLSYCARVFFRTDLFLVDAGGLGAFATIYGTLYGIMSAFIIFEVWEQFNGTQELIGKEALGLERLYKLTLYFRDVETGEKMKEALKDYIGLVVQDRLKSFERRQQNKEISRAFRKISEVISGVAFDDKRDHVIFSQVVSTYGDLAETRRKRINRILTRLPGLLRLFFYVSSCIAFLTSVIMPFANFYFGAFVVGGFGIILSMVFQIIEDLDNPFNGHWTFTTEPFERALRHIEED